MTGVEEPADQVEDVLEAGVSAWESTASLPLSASGSLQTGAMI